jgi:cytoskeleton protein RodZ
MEAEQDKVSETPRQGTIGPGERLQAARIKKGLTIEDVANRMHLSTSILEAIEENNFDEITAPIFVKGYLRAYARIVALNEDEMIAQYLDLYSEEDPPISSTSNMVPELSSTDARIKWTTYFVVVLLAVLLAAWWWNKQQNQVPPLSLDVPSTTEVEEPASDAVVDSDIQAGSESPTSEAVVEVESPQAEDASTAGTGEPTGSAVGTVENAEAEENVTETDTAETAVVQTGTMATPEPAAIATVEVEPTPAAADATAASEAAQAEEAPAVVAGTRQLPGIVAPSGSDKLRIVVHADTWADVKDANNYQLVYDLLRANSTMELSGQAPFVIFLGNGHGVEIQFNGEQLEFSAKIRDDNTTRINVGG